ncbi:MAG: hypothetical protein F6K50_37605 [Moorea sp. SIO3I7]|nr:hypothetical protein [Moorena sp. SIO3I7]
MSFIKKICNFSQIGETTLCYVVSIYSINGWIKFMFLESVILFFKRLAADKNFRSQLEDAASPEDYQTWLTDKTYLGAYW